uniref:Uncharacterized protein n=1 Tax=Helianthus annuus TaxID=4232 RepID=A0A251SMP3_HELAN
MCISQRYVKLIYPYCHLLLSLLKSSMEVKGQDVAFEPTKLLWLIQRDFLLAYAALCLTCLRLMRRRENTSSRVSDNCPRSFSWNSPSLLVRFTRNRNAINVDLSRYKKAS